jgi:hypothetical protein
MEITRGSAATTRLVAAASAGNNWKSTAHRGLNLTFGWFGLAHRLVPRGNTRNIVVSWSQE